MTKIYITDTEGQRMTKGHAKMFMQDGEEGWLPNMTIQCQFWGQGSMLVLVIAVE